MHQPRMWWNVYQMVGPEVGDEICSAHVSLFSSFTSRNTRTAPLGSARLLEQETSEGFKGAAQLGKSHQNNVLPIKWPLS